MEKPDLGGLVAKVMLSAGSISSSVPAVACDGCREALIRPEIGVSKNNSQGTKTICMYSVTCD